MIKFDQQAPEIFKFSQGWMIMLIVPVIDMIPVMKIPTQ